MNPEAQHLLLDMWLSQPVEDVVDKICDYIDHKFTVVNRVSHGFKPQGRTVVYVLSESHFSVHTYPEHGYITLDIYICSKDYDLFEVEKHILSLAEPSDFNSNFITRGKNE